MSTAFNVLICFNLLFLGIAHAEQFPAPKSDGHQNIIFPRGVSPRIVATTATPLEKKTLGRLVKYLEQVLGKPAKVTTTLPEAANTSPVIILATDSQSLPLTIKPLGDNDESYALVTGTVQGYPVVMAVGKTDRANFPDGLDSGSGVWRQSNRTCLENTSEKPPP